MSQVDVEPAFNLVVEAVGASTTLLPPPGWESNQHKVGSLTIDAHTRLPTTPSYALGAPILTLHDVGLNAGTCFGPFFAFCRTSPSHCAEIDAAAAHFHLTAPGHAPDAQTLPATEQLDVSTLVSGVEDVLDRFELRRVVGFGVGLGAAALLRAALKRPKAFAGLVLISPVIAASGVAERVAVGVDGLFTQKLGFGLSRRAKDRFLHRWLSDSSRESNFSLVQNVEDGLDRLNASNLLRLLAADTWRDDITAKLGEVKARLLLVTGKDSALRYHTAEAFALFDAANTSWLDVADSGSLVHEEHPDQVARSVSLLLEGLPPIG